MATTYLTLTNLVCRRVNEEALTSSTFSGALGAHATIKDAVNASIREIQLKYPEWPWNKVSRNFACVADGTVEYTPASDVGNIDWDTFQIVRDDAASPPIVAKALTKVDYTWYAQNLRPKDEQLDSTGYGIPDYVIRSQNNTILLSTVPSQTFQVKYEAWTIPDDLSAYSDICVIPDRYNSTIVEGALKRVYDFRGAIQERQLAEKTFNEGVAYMYRIEIPNQDSFKSPVLNRGTRSPWVAYSTW